MNNTIDFRQLPYSVLKAILYTFEHEPDIPCRGCGEAVTYEDFLILEDEHYIRIGVCSEKCLAAAKLGEEDLRTRLKDNDVTRYRVSISSKMVEHLQASCSKHTDYQDLAESLKKQYRKEHVWK